MRKSILAMAFALCAIVLDPAAGAAKEILFINPGFADKGFWHDVSGTMRAAAAQFGYKLSIVSADRKWPLMVSKGLAAIKSHNPDYLIIANEHQQAPLLLQAADKKGIPTLLLLNDLTAEQKKTYGGPREIYKHWIGSITPDNAKAGYEMAVSLIDFFKKEGVGKVKLLSLAGDFITPASQVRMQGLDRALREFSGTIHEVRRLTVNWSESEAYERTNLFFQTATANAIWAANDPIALGAMRALRQRGLEPGRDVAVAGLNWSNPAIDAVIKGEMTMTHGGHFFAGAWGIVLINDYDHGVDFKDLGTVIRFPMSALTKERAVIYKAALGDQNWSKINFRAFSRQDGALPHGYDFTLKRILANIH